MIPARPADVGANDDGMGVRETPHPTLDASGGYAAAAELASVSGVAGSNACFTTYAKRQKKTATLNKNQRNQKRTFKNKNNTNIWNKHGLIEKK